MACSDLATDRNRLMPTSLTTPSANEGVILIARDALLITSECVVGVFVIAGHGRQQDSVDGDEMTRCRWRHAAGDGGDDDEDVADINLPSVRVWPVPKPYVVTL